MEFNDEVKSAINLLATYNSPCFMMDEHKNIVWHNESAKLHYPLLSVGSSGAQLLQNQDESLILKQLKNNSSIQVEQDLYPLSGKLLSFLPLSQDPFLVLAVLSKRFVSPNDTEDSSRILNAFANAYKTNLTSNDSIYSYISRKLNDQDNYETDKYMQILVRNNYKMLRDTNNIVTITKMLNSIFKLKSVYSDVHKFLHTTLSAIKTLLEPNDIPFDFSVPTKELYTKFDPEQLNAVLTNLISNSFIYTRDFNKVFVQVTTVGNHVTIKVTDKGVGIKEEHKPYIRQPYFSYNSASEFGGLGVGLYLCDEVAKAMGGTMFVSSEYGEGTVVSFTFPITQADEEPSILNSKTSDYIQNRFSSLYIGLCHVCFFPHP